MYVFIYKYIKKEKYGQHECVMCKVICIGIKKQHQYQTDDIYQLICNLRWDSAFVIIF